MSWQQLKYSWISWFHRYQTGALKCLAQRHSNKNQVDSVRLKLRAPRSPVLNFNTEPDWTPAMHFSKRIASHVSTNACYSFIVIELRLIFKCLHSASRSQPSKMSDTRSYSKHQDRNRNLSLHVLTWNVWTRILFYPICTTYTTQVSLQ